MSQRKHQTWNFSIDSEYHTQRNNMLIPLESCNTTSMVMAIEQAGYELDPGRYDQPEDRLTAFLQTDEAYSEMRKQAPWAFNEKTGEALYRPNEVHQMLTWAVNQLFHESVSIFRTDWESREIVHWLLTGGGVVLSGKFPLPSGKALSHVVSLAGFILDEPATKDKLLDDHESGWRVTQWIIDDPYGDWHSGYSDHHGNNTQLSADEWLKVIKQTDSLKKWAHFIHPTLQVGNI